MNRSSLPRILCLAVVSIGCGLLLRGKTISAAPAPASNKTKIVGVWEVTKSEDAAPAGATLEFTKDGKLKVSAKIGDQALSFEGTYKVDGNKLVATMKGPDGKERTETMILVKLTASELITKDEKGRRDEFKKKK